VSLAGDMLQRHGSGIRHMATPGLLSRCVQDLQIGFRLIAGPDGRDWQVPRIPLVDPPDRPLRELKIAWTDDLGGLPVTAATRAALERVATQLERLGCQVERAAPRRFDIGQVWQTYGDILGGEAGAAFPAPVRQFAGFMGRFLHRDTPVIRAVQRGMAINLPRYMAALARRDAIIGDLEAFLATRDAWLCPVASGPAFTHRKPAPYLTSGKRIDVDGRSVSYWTGSLGHTSVFNLIGSPVVVLPLGQSDGGLPIGVQVVGRRWHDMELLAVAQQLSSVTGAFARPPGY
jgi:amidase